MEINTCIEIKHYSYFPWFFCVKLKYCGSLFLAHTDLSIDAMDVSGEQQLDVDHHLFKQRLNADGEKIKDTEPEKEGTY